MIFLNDFSLDESRCSYVGHLFFRLWAPDAAVFCPTHRSLEIKQTKKKKRLKAEIVKRNEKEEEMKKKKK